MTKLLPLNSIVRVVPAHAYDEGANLNPGGLYMIREVACEDVGTKWITEGEATLYNI